MKKRKFLSFISFVTSIAILLTSMALTNILTVSAADNTDYTPKAMTDLPPIADIPASSYAGGKYGYETLDCYTAQEAAEAGVPEGYSDNVWKLTTLTSQGTNGETGIVLDFTSWGIKVDGIKSMTIRYYVDNSCSNIRLAYNENLTAISWILNTSSITKEQWAEITISDGFDQFNNNDDGTLGKVAFCFRRGSTFYVDSITFDLAESETEGKDYFETPVGRDEFPYTKPNSSLYAYATYNYKAMEIYTPEEAAVAGVPEGYSGYVMMLSGTSEVGISMDFSEWKIPLGLINSMSFRVYVPSTIAEVRLSNTKDFIVRHTPEQKDTWIDITLYPDGTGFNNKNFNSFLNEDQTLGAVHFCLRYPNGTTDTAYLDGFTFDLKENDGVAPVIQYQGNTTIETSAGKPFVLQDLVAYDEQEDRYIAPTLTWSEGALDENKLLQKGTHTCVATFTDAHGNKSQITLNLLVGDVDTQAPEIKFGLSQITATAGTRVDLAKTIKVIDNYDVVTPVLTWSEGALDAHNRLQVGTHTLTITATDLTGLTSQKTVTFVVTDTPDAPVTPTPVQ